MTGQRYRGLLIGNESFPRDPHGLPALAGPLIDIDQLQQALTDDQVGLFSPGDLLTLPDWSVQDLRERFDEFFATANREDILLMYYSGHGELDELNTLYLCAHDTNTRYLRSTALSSTEINNMIDGSAAATTIIVLDCCYSGAFKGADLAAPVTGRGRYVLASSRATQLTQAARSSQQPSPFTGLLVRGLRHAVAQGHLTVAELYRQVHLWMTEEGTPAPQLRITGEGDVIIARRDNRPLPAVDQPLAARARQLSTSQQAHARDSTPPPLAEMGKPTTQPTRVPNGHPAPSAKTQRITAHAGTKSKKLTTWQIKGVVVLMTLVVALGIGGLVWGGTGVAWHPLAEAMRSDSPASFALLLAIFGGLAAAILVSDVAGAVVPRFAGTTVKFIAGLAGFVVGGGSFVFAIPGGVTILEYWMSPAAATWTSLIVIFVVVAIAFGWYREAQR